MEGSLMAAVEQSTPSTLKGVQRGDQIFGNVLRVGAIFTIIVLVILFVTLVIQSLPVFQEYGLSYLTGTTWRPNATDTKPMEFGALPYIYGTVITSLLALLLATPLAIGAAIYVSEYAPPWLAKPVSFMVELLVTIPSVAY